MDYMQDKIRVMTEQLDALRVSGRTPLDSFLCCPAPYKTDNRLPEGPWTPWDRERDSYQDKDAHYWFRCQFTAPEARPGQTLYFQMEIGTEADWDALSPQGILYLNGELVQGLDINHRRALLEPGREYSLAVYLYTGMTGDAGKFLGDLVWVDQEVNALYYDLTVPLDASCCLKEGSREYWQILNALDGAVRLLDLREPGSRRFRDSVAQARDFLRREFYEKVCGRPAPVVHCVGHTHIDVAWLWTLAQTREKAQRSFSTVLRLMEEFPEYRFMSSQPQLYQFVKEEAPELYEQILRRVREGRWEVEGAMWLEADCNLTSGESLVRQILYGKRFMKEEFGVDSRTLWLPDVFGYSAALPQLLRKSGVDRFFTTKISWSETNKMPYDMFRWQGIDGTEIFTCFGTAQDLPAPGENDTYTTYVGNTEPKMVLGTWERFQQKAYSDHTVLTFGHGDGGGGPTRHHLEVQRRTAYGLPGFPRTEIGSTDDYFTLAEEDFQKQALATGRVPRWVGELYLEFHRGTYTSVAKNKRNNRRCEFLYQKAETLAVLAGALCGLPWPKEALREGWRTILLNQFHDIIPGSSIHEVYEDSDRQYAELFAQGGALAGQALTAIAGRTEARGLLVYNPLGFPRSDVLEYQGKRYWVEEIPAMGWRILTPEETPCGVRAGDRSLENGRYRLEMDESGGIASLFDKAAGRELCRPGRRLNELLVYEDFPRDYDAWELSAYYRDKHWEADPPVSWETVREGVRAGIRTVRHYGNSIITQTVFLYDGLPRVDFETEVDWHQRHQLLKAVFPLDIHAAQAAYEIQFGHVLRPTHSNTSWDAARFEVCAHKWADVSENGYGVSLLNDCKYGYSAEGGTLTLSLLKSATYPDPEADQGRHAFTYSLLPHAGSLQDGGTIQQGYCLNQPLMAVPAPGGGTLPDQFSLASCACPGIVLETVKPAEDGDDLILRFYESFGRRGEAVITLGIPFSQVTVCDLLENPVPCPELRVSGREIILPVRCFDVVTLRIRPSAG